MIFSRCQRTYKVNKPFRAKITLIPLTWPGSKYKVSSSKKINEFKKYISEKGQIVVTVHHQEMMLLLHVDN